MKQYSDQVENARQAMIKEVLEIAPVSYIQDGAAGSRSVAVNKDGSVEANGYAEMDGVYFGATVETLSLSDLALLIDGHVA